MTEESYLFKLPNNYYYTFRLDDDGITASIRVDNNVYVEDGESLSDESSADAEETEKECVRYGWSKDHLYLYDSDEDDWEDVDVNTKYSVEDYVNKILSTPLQDDKKNKKFKATKSQFVTNVITCLCEDLADGVTPDWLPSVTTYVFDKDGSMNSVHKEVHIKLNQISDDVRKDFSNVLKSISG